MKFFASKRANVRNEEAPPPCLHWVNPLRTSFMDSTYSNSLQAVIAQKKATALLKRFNTKLRRKVKNKKFTLPKYSSLLL